MPILWWCMRWHCLCSDWSDITPSSWTLGSGRWSSTSCMPLRDTSASRCPLICPSSVSLSAVQAEPSSVSQLQTTLQDIFSTIEQFWEGGENSIGPAHLFFQLLDEVRATLPVSFPLSSLFSPLIPSLSLCCRYLQFSVYSTTTV